MNEQYAKSLKEVGNHNGGIMTNEGMTYNSNTLFQRSSLLDVRRGVPHLLFLPPHALPPNSLLSSLILCALDPLPPHATTLDPPPYVETRAPS